MLLLVISNSIYISDTIDLPKTYINIISITNKNIISLNINIAIINLYVSQ